MAISLHSWSSKSSTLSMGVVYGGVPVTLLQSRRRSSGRNLNSTVVATCLDPFTKAPREVHDSP